MVFRRVPLFIRTAACAAAISGWIASGRAAANTPDYFQRVIGLANVTFDFYDPVRDPKVHRGYASFRVEVLYDSSFQYRWEDRRGVRMLAIQVQIGDVVCKMVNEVQLPDYLNTDQRWDHSLVQHEFDHVAMTIDPRVQMLTEHLCRKVTRIVRPFPSETRLDDALIERLIHEEVEPRYKAVIDLLIANEYAYDVATAHGARRLPDRQAYFRSLFTEPNLKEHGFPYLSEVRDLIRQREYREAVLPYSLRE